MPAQKSAKPPKTAPDTAAKAVSKTAAKAPAKAAATKKVQTVYKSPAELKKAADELLKKKPTRAKAAPAAEPASVAPETIAIAEELASRHPQAGLWPADPKARAIVRLFDDPNEESALRLRLSIATTDPAATTAEVARAYRAYRRLGVRHAGPEMQYASYLLNAARSPRCPAWPAQNSPAAPAPRMMTSC